MKPGGGDDDDDDDDDDGADENGMMPNMAMLKGMGKSVQPGADAETLDSGMKKEKTPSPGRGIYI